MVDEERNPGYHDSVFLHRSGKNVAQMVIHLCENPRYELNEDAKVKVREYENELAGQKLEKGTTIEQSLLAKDGNAETMFTLPFRTGTVKVEGVDFLGTEDRNVGQYFAEAIRNGTISKKDFGTLAKKSRDAVIKVLEHAILNDEEISDDELGRLDIVPDPEKLLENARMLDQARAYVKKERMLRRETGANIESAERAIDDIYLAKINAWMVAKLIALDTLKRQSELIGDTEMSMAAQGVISKFRGIKGHLGDDEKRMRTLMTLDRLKYGIYVGQDGATSIVEGLNEIASTKSDDNKAMTEAMFTAEQVSKLKTKMISPEEILGLFKQVLAMGGKLSEEDSSTWTPDRPNRASDGKFQVIFNDKTSGFEVDGKSGVLKTPTVSRSVWDVLVIGDHELAHLDQAEANRTMQEEDRLRIAWITGKRAVALKETGADVEQREFETKLSGEARPYSLAYAEGLRVIENGGGITKAAKAFYEQKLREEPGADKTKMAALAADRVTRLIRQGGFSSQAMNYAEEAIVEKDLQKLPSHMRARAIAVTALDYVDQIRLHKYGLISLPKNTDEAGWQDKLLSVLSQKIRDALQ